MGRRVRLTAREIAVILRRLELIPWIEDDEHEVIKALRAKLA